MSANRKRRIDAYHGALIADAVSMPVHWYYDRSALLRDYGKLTGYLEPKNPHPDSILWRSSYTTLNERGEILHNQAKYWGQRGVHYHQFLKGGENTLNFQLAIRLHKFVNAAGSYDPGAWLDHYIAFMLDPDSHNDTYLEECHRDFFTRYAKGVSPLKCGSADLHIGGLAHVAALIAAVPETDAALIDVVLQHVKLTHDHPDLVDSAKAFTKILSAMEAGQPLQDAILEHGGDRISASKFAKWSREPDEIVIGRHLSPACYIRDAFPAALYLSWKYANDFESGILANAMVGGDNCHRGAVVGALLGFNNGVAQKWTDGLVSLGWAKN